jgi:UDPglucose 6-dehydrogenase
VKICVMGLWHLGSVTAACLASAGHKVSGFDFNEEIVSKLQQGCPPIFEPGLEDLVKTGLENRNLFFTTDPLKAFQDSEIVWVAYDTPVDEDDHADVSFVVEQISKIFKYLNPSTLVLISSQLPAGTIRVLEAESRYLNKGITFACSPENLRLGMAIDIFKKPDRIIVGVRSEIDQNKIEKMLRPITDKIEWMSVESAEMTKHAINAFLATSVVFINELATLCESVGADAKEVERGLKSESRIGPKAYLSPGGAFAGGTLARDIAFLIEFGHKYNLPTYLFSSVKSSNNAHKLWPRHKLQQLFGCLRGKVVAIWGLTYKPGTNTLRRSSSVELCQWLLEQGAVVQAHDPAIENLPDMLAAIRLYTSAEEALKYASALVVATEWPIYRSIDKIGFISSMATPNIIDPNGFLSKTVSGLEEINYMTVGRSPKNI